MAAIQTTDNFVTNVQKYGSIPNPSDNFPPQTILDIGQDQLEEAIIPILISFDEGYYLETIDVPFVANQAEYTLPQYGMWNKLRRVDWLNTNNDLIPMTRVEVDELPLLNNISQNWSYFFYLKNDTIVILPTPPNPAIGSFRLYIYRRPGEMVTVDKAAQVQSVNKVTGQVTYTAVPPATFTASSIHDFYASILPNRRVGTAVQATAIAANVQTFPVAAVQNLNANDYVCVVDETVFVPLPKEMRQLLEQFVILEINKITMDAAEYQLRRAALVDSVQMVKVSAPGARVQGQAKKLSLANNALFGRRRYF